MKSLRKIDLNKIKRPKIWYVCNKCREWFTPKDHIKSKICPDCKQGELIKICAYCGKKYSNCICD